MLRSCAMKISYDERTSCFRNALRGQNWRKCSGIFEGCTGRRCGRQQGRWSGGRSSLVALSRRSGRASSAASRGVLGISAEHFVAASRADGSKRFIVSGFSIRTGLLGKTLPNGPVPTPRSRERWSSIRTKRAALMNSNLSTGPGRQTHAPYAWQSAVRDPGKSSGRTRKIARPGHG